VKWDVVRYRAGEHEGYEVEGTSTDTRGHHLRMLWDICRGEYHWLYEGRVQVLNVVTNISVVRDDLAVWFLIGKLPTTENELMARVLARVL